MIPTWTLIRSTHFSTFDTLIQFLHCLESGYRVIRQIHQTKILSKWRKSEHCGWSSVESFSKILIRSAWTILTDSSAFHHIDQTAIFQGQSGRVHCGFNWSWFVLCTVSKIIWDISEWYTKSCLVGHQNLSLDLNYLRCRLTPLSLPWLRGSKPMCRESHLRHFHLSGGRFMPHDENDGDDREHNHNDHRYDNCRDRSHQ